MNNLNLYAIKDVEAKQFGMPFAAMNEDLARRNISLALAEDKIIQHDPSKHELWYVGTYDPDTGKLHQGKTSPTRMCKLSELFVKPNGGKQT